MEDNKSGMFWKRDQVSGHVAQFKTCSVAIEQMVSHGKESGLHGHSPSDDESAAQLPPMRKSPRGAMEIPKTKTLRGRNQNRLHGHRQ